MDAAKALHLLEDEMLRLEPTEEGAAQLCAMLERECDAQVCDDGNQEYGWKKLWLESHFELHMASFWGLPPGSVWGLEGIISKKGSSARLRPGASFL